MHLGRFSTELGFNYKFCPSESIEAPTTGLAPCCKSRAVNHKARESEISLQQLLPVRDLIESHERLEARLEILSDKIFPIYQTTANLHGLPFNSRKDMVKVFPLVTDADSVEVLNEYFVLRLARKQMRMALGIRELDSLPSP